MSEHLELTEDEFETQYRPMYTGPDNNAVYDDIEILRKMMGYVPIERVWTIVDTEGDLYALPGYHRVNRIGYVVTEVPWPHENVTAEWFIFDDGDHEEEL